MSRGAAAIVGVGVLLLAACAGTPGAAGSGHAEGRSSGGPPATLTVFAAASLKPTFTELGRRFEASHAGVSVAFDFAGSSDLVAQLQAGAPADVFASADIANMAKAVAAGLVTGPPTTFASNTLEIAVPPDNPARVRSFADLARPGVQAVVCAPQVPCGSATTKLEEATGVRIEPVSEEQSVTDVLNKVSSGEADAGVVYVTDVKAAGSTVQGITVAESAEAVNVYPIAVLAATKNPKLAREFVDLVTGAEGRRVLSQAGFGRP